MPFIPAKSVQSVGFTSASDAILNSQNKTQTPTTSNFGGAFNPQVEGTLGQIDKTLSSGTGVIGGAASGVYTAAKGLATLGKDVAVDSFNAVNHPLDSIGKAYDFTKNEIVNQGKGNENTDTVGKLVQSTVGSKGALGVGQELGNLATDKMGYTTGAFSGMKLAGNTLNTILTAATGGQGRALTSESLKFATDEALQNGVINKVIHDTILKQGAGLLGKYLAGGTIGAGFQAASNLQEGAPVTQNLDKAFYAGGGVPVVAQGVSSTLSGAKTLKNKITGNSAVTSDNIDTLAGTITQGKKADIATAKKALANIDVSGVKTYDDLASVLNNKINETRTNLDAQLLTNTERKPLDQLTFTHKVGDAEIAHNYVQDSLSQLEAHYKAINDQVGVEKITQLTEKAQKEGLTAKEVNDLARVHGQELNAFNANGQAASGLSKQAAENTRTGLKETAKSIFKDELFNTADKEMTNLIRTKELVQGVSEKVNQLKQRIQERSLGAKVGVALGKTINLLSLGTAKGIVEALIPRGQGFKVMNALDLESTLKGNLEKLQKAMDGKTEAEILNNLNSIQSSKDLLTNKNTISIPKNSNIPAQSTPTLPKSKGIRGMINFKEIGLAFTKEEKNIVETALKDLKLAKSEQARIDFLQPVKELFLKERLVSPSEKLNSTQLEEMAWRTLEDSNAVMGTVAKQAKDRDIEAEKKAMSTPFVRDSLGRFDSKKKVVSSLEQEAKKYKSAEEFVNTSTELTYKNLQENPYSIKAYGKDFNEPVEYHRAGTIKKNGDIWLTDNPAGASQYSSAGGGTKTGSYVVQSKNPLIIDTAGGKYANGNIDINKILTKEEVAQGYTNNPTTKQKFIDYAKKNGYDAVQFADSFPDGEGGMRSLVVWNKDQIKTKSQLTDIWNKANGK